MPESLDALITAQTTRKSASQIPRAQPLSKCACEEAKEQHWESSGMCCNILFWPESSAVRTEKPVLQKASQETMGILQKFTCSEFLQARCKQHFIYTLQAQHADGFNKSLEGSSDRFYEIRLMEALINNFHTLYCTYTYCMQIRGSWDRASQLVQLYRHQPCTLYRYKVGATEKVPATKFS